ncbi:hypothetical protein [Kitasatospora sp. NPDC059571]|uniref:hypothetical protein n=1 Tax=Kitasatospora sp. NPDC059571 TaxID=3346871 RepID=UPI0036B41933
MSRQPPVGEIKSLARSISSVSGKKIVGTLFGHHGGTRRDGLRPGREEPVMTASEQVDADGLAELVRACEDVRVRLVLVKDEGDQWRLHHGEVLLDDLGADREETWLYPTAAFVAWRLRGWVVADLLRGKPTNIDRFHVSADQQTVYVSADDLRGNQAWTGRTTPWPRTEWTIRRDSTDYRNHGVLVGDTSHPSFLNFDRAVSSFLYQRPYDSRTPVDQLWRAGGAPGFGRSPSPRTGSPPTSKATTWTTWSWN